MFLCNYSRPVKEEAHLLVARTVFVKSNWRIVGLMNYVVKMLMCKCCISVQFSQLSDQFVSHVSRVNVWMLLRRIWLIIEELSTSLHFLHIQSLFQWLIVASERKEKKRFNICSCRDAAHTVSHQQRRYVRGSEEDLMFTWMWAFRDFSYLHQRTKTQCLFAAGLKNTACFYT